MTYAESLPVHYAGRLSRFQDCFVEESRAAIIRYRLNNSSDLRQRVTEVGVACPRGLARIDDLTVGMTDVIGAWIGYGADALRHTLMQLNLLTRLFMDATGNAKEQRYLLEPTIPQFCILPMMYASKSDHFTG